MEQDTDHDNASAVSTKFGLSLASLRVAIVGGGLGGLACALALQQAGISNVLVFEKDDCFLDRREGFGLTLTNNKKGPLAKLGLLEECVKSDCASNQHWVFKPNGHLLGYYGRGLLGQESAVSSESPSSAAIGMAERGNLRIPRQVLRSVLLSRLNPGVVRWGHKLLSYEENREGIIATFLKTQGNDTDLEQRIDMDFDVLIGADGLRSSVRAIRESLNPDLQPSPLRYIGICVIIGLSTARHDFVDAGGFYIVDGTHRLFVMPYSTTDQYGPNTRALTMWQLSFSGVSEEESRKYRNLTSEELTAEALRRTKEWMAPVQDLILNTDASDIWGTALFDRDRLSLKSKHASGLSARKRKIAALETSRSPSNGGESEAIGTFIGANETCVTLLGDAGHPMSMFKGQGCNQALEDGPLLASYISKPGLTRYNLCTRIRCYEREMISRTESKVLASREAAGNYHSIEVFNSSFGVEGIPPSLTSSIVEKVNQKLTSPPVSSAMLISLIKETLASLT